MGSLKCPLCCRAEFPNRRALQQHLLDVLDLLKCPTCSKSFTSILGLVQHLSLSSCNVDVGVNFDEHFVTYVDCSFMKANKSDRSSVVSAVEPPKQQPEPPEPVQQSAVLPEVSMRSLEDAEVIIPDSCNVTTDEELGVVLDCESDQVLPDGEVICINLDHGVTGLEVLPGNKVVQKSTPTTTTIAADSACSQTERAEQERAKKIAVPNGPQVNKPEESHSNVGCKYIYQCSECGGKYDSKQDFAKHKCGNNFGCEVCGTRCVTAAALKVHRKLHDREALEIKMNGPCTETLECGTCGEKVGNNMAEAHELSHARKLKISQCQLCPAAYLSMSKLNEHISKCHGESKAYVCEVCNKTFKTFSYLKTHRELHKAEKRYKCTYCEKSYHRKQDKIKHEYIHTGEKPVECNVCGRCFRTSFSLSVHLTTHNDERPYQCSFCSKRFKSRAVCAHHIKLHGDSRPYTCSQCPKSFKTQVGLAGHVNRHTKPYSCDLCQKQFASKFSLKIHMPLHNNPEKKDRFKCSVCGEVFARQSALLEHLKEHDSHRNVAEIVKVEQTEVEYIAEEILVEGREIIIGD